MALVRVSALVLPWAYAVATLEGSAEMELITEAASRGNFGKCVRLCNQQSCCVTQTVGREILHRCLLGKTTECAVKRRGGHLTGVCHIFDGQVCGKIFVNQGDGGVDTLGLQFCRMKFGDFQKTLQQFSCDLHFGKSAGIGILGQRQKFLKNFS